MRQSLFRLLKNDNLILIYGSLISQLTIVVFYPIISRIYTPDEFGVFSVFLSTASILGLIATLRMDLAIVTESVSPFRKIKLISFAFYAVAIFSLITIGPIVVLVLFYDVDSVFLLLPFSVFFIGIFTVFNSTFLANSFEPRISKAKVIRSFIAPLSQLSFNAGGLNAFGLIYGRLLSEMLTFCYQYYKSGLKIIVLNLRQLTAYLWHYSRYPKFNGLNTLLNLLYQFFNVYMLTFFFNSEIVGNYSIVFKLLVLPVQIISHSIGQIILKQTSRLFAEGKEMRWLITRRFAQLAIMAIPAFAILYMFSEDLIRFILGDQWKFAGAFAMALIPLFIARFTVSPFLVVFTVLKKQHLETYFNILLLIFSGVSVAICNYLHMDATGYLELFSLVSGTLYLLAFAVILKLVRI
jgi:O-antigen/teichoic acid export membrane protein